MHMVRNYAAHLLHVCFLVILSGCGGFSHSDESSVVDSTRFITKNKPIRFVDESNSVAQYQIQPFDAGVGLTVSLDLSILPPPSQLTGGQQVYASDLAIYGSRVVAGYNVPGVIKRGWLEYIDVTLLLVPLVLGQRYFEKLDVNSVEVMGSNMVVAGAEEGGGAALLKGNIDLSGFNVDEESKVSINSYAATGVAINGSTIAVTTGDDGGLSLRDSNTLNSTLDLGIDDARDVAYHSNTNSFFVVSGQPGTLRKYNAAGSLVNELHLGGASIPESKSVVKAGKEFILATKGDGGFSLVCANDNQVAASVPQFIYPNHVQNNLPGPSLTVTNGIAFGPGLIFVAAGEAGVRIYSFLRKTTGVNPTSCQNTNVSYLGYIEFGENVSANNLYYRHILSALLVHTGVLYVAAGSGGFKAITVVGAIQPVNDLKILDF